MPGGDGRTDRITEEERQQRIDEGNAIKEARNKGIENPSFCFNDEGAVRPCAEGEQGTSFIDRIGPGIVNFLNLLGQGGSAGSGGQGGGGGGAGRTGGEGQASGSGQPESVQNLREMLTTLIGAQTGNGPPTFNLDPRFAQQFGALQNEAADQSGRLAELDPQARADFEAQEAARVAEVEQQAQQGRDQLLTRLFGSGAQQSTQAASQAGEFETGVARAQQAVRGEVAGQRLQTRQFLTQQNLANLQLRFEGLAQEQTGALQELGINADAVNSERNRNARLLSDVIGFETQERTAVRTARIGANAQIRAAGINADAQRYSSRLGFASDLSSLAAQRELGLLNRDIALRELDVARRGQDTDLEIAKLGGAAADAASRRAARGQALGSFASLAVGLAGIFAASDRRLKQDVHTLGWVGPIRIVSFRYLGKAFRHVGVIAQEVRNLFPDAVAERHGFLFVNYRALGV